MYKIPEEYFFRIHHVRPRFKNDVENVLIFVAEEISKLTEMPCKDFADELNWAIRKYPGNSILQPKTINNWRTEISSLFGFVQHNIKTDEPGYRAIELAENQDLVEAFKIFLYNFQYPGAHIKPESILEQINKGVHFKPAQYILKLLRYAEGKAEKSIGITKAEVCHCIFNDLRVTRDNEDVKLCWNRIEKNRNGNIKYDSSGDVIRYAGDILDYMEIANLLKTYDGRTYYLNSLETQSIIKFCESKEWFSEYDNMIEQKHGYLDKIKSISNDWFKYVNRKISDTDFSTDILSFISSDENELEVLKSNYKDIISNINNDSDLEKADILIDNRIKNELKNFSTKDIGDIGENLVLSHECMRIKLGGRADLIHLIKRIPTSFAVGYDISSIELDEKKRYIEVKTTISSKPLHFNRVHLTKNEWNTADSTHDRYYIYRLLLNKTEKKLFLLQDPVGLYKKDLIQMSPSNGADIIFDPQKVGIFTELLTWQN